MLSNFKILIVSSVALGIAGCSSTGDSLNDMMGLSKDVPDESQVRTNQALAMPPDLQLRAPSGEVTETGQPNPYAQTGTVQPPATTPPQTAYPAEPDYNAPVQNQQVATTQQQVATTQQQVAAAPQQVQPNQAADVYAQHGISRYNPDGTEKDQGQLTKELRAAIQAKKRTQNKNYGTVFNVGELFN
ncbi:MAG: hypothetical protein ACR2OJ_16445 [Hyphomicrobiales bacterium]